jgi:DNA repair exonuclease SbcCD ATPase subunit
LPPRLAALEARIDELEQIKAEAVEAEDFAEAKAAKQLADSARRLLEVCTSIAQLEREKVVAVNAENFAHAKKLKAKIESLQQEERELDAVLGAPPATLSERASAALAEWRAKLSDLDARKAAAVEGEEYEVASVLKVDERALRARCEQLTELLAAKEQAATADDFGLASQLKKELDALLDAADPLSPTAPRRTAAAKAPAPPSARAASGSKAAGADGQCPADVRLHIEADCHKCETQVRRSFGFVRNAMRVVLCCADAVLCGCCLCGCIYRYEYI